ncbi:alpha/beta hydrolase [Rathayibacter sp. YIM 133350]|uniref:alpha/beta fold hydrolase n=1 Tax=Rathayibacter sp. YIM 133350 TaxID=3131992 RepID=UPI00307EE03E
MKQHVRDEDDAARRDHRLGDLDWMRLPEGTVRSTFAAPSGELAMISLGDPADPRVLLVPGATGSKEDFILVMPLLAQAGFYVQSYDLAGQYESAAAGPREGRYTYDLFVDDMVAVIEAGARPVHLLGYSFAGVIAQLVSVRRPELVASLALLGCPPQSGLAYRGIPVIGPISRVVTPRQGAGLMIWGVSTNKNRVLPGRLALARHRFAYTRRESVDDIIGLMFRTPDVSPEVRATGVPVLVTAGARDLWPARLQRAFAERLGARLALYDTGHSPCETTPHQLARDLVEHYRRAAAGDLAA